MRKLLLSLAASLTLSAASPELAHAAPEQPDSTVGQTTSDVSDACKAVLQVNLSFGEDKREIRETCGRRFLRQFRDDEERRAIYLKMAREEERAMIEEGRYFGYAAAFFREAGEEVKAKELYLLAAQRAYREEAFEYAIEFYQLAGEYASARWASQVAAQKAEEEGNFLTAARYYRLAGDKRSAREMKKKDRVEPEKDGGAE